MLAIRQEMMKVIVPFVGLFSEKVWDPALARSSHVKGLWPASRRATFGNGRTTPYTCTTNCPSSTVTR